MTTPAMLMCSACCISLPVPLLLVYDLLPRPPQRGGGDLRDVAAVGVPAGYLRARALGDQPGKVAQTVGFGHLIVDVDAVAPLGRVPQGELYAAHGVLDVDERPGLAARAVNG